ncbi:MAG: FHIPEP family type III secretion protein [Thermoleophilia bacterium]|nr:FHIPEP family type III secretion protein [Thermoleophilia bacterium]
MIRAELMRLVGFGPREILVDARSSDADVRHAWELLVWGEPTAVGDHSEIGIVADEIERAILHSLSLVLSPDDIHELLEFVRLEAPAIYASVGMNPHSRMGVLNVCRELLRDGVSIAPFSRIVELVGSREYLNQDPDRAVVEQVRLERRRSIVTPLLQNGTLTVMEMSLGAAAACVEVDSASDSGDRRLNQLTARLASDLTGRDRPIIVAPPGTRPSVSLVLHQVRPDAIVLDEAEVRIEAVTLRVDGILGRGIRVATLASEPRRVWRSAIAHVHGDDVQVLEPDSDAVDWNW